MKLVSDPLITKYRPQKWSEVVGHQSEVASLRDAVANGTAHAFLFSGRPGMGKTTLMRLVARYLGAEEIDEIAAAVYTSVDDMRALTEGLRYRPLNTEVRVVVLDECHRLSKNAWDSLLKIVEEPPDWLYWGFCTTEPAKVPPAIRRRCLSIELKEVSKNTLADFLDDVAQKEGLADIDGGILDVCAREAKGSPGQALANLALCVQARDRAEAVQLLRAAVASGDTDAGTLCRLLLEGAPWVRIQPVLYELRETDAESLRYAVRGYFSKVLIEQNDPDKAARLMTILEPFSQPFFGISDVALAVGKIVFEQA